MLVVTIRTFESINQLTPNLQLLLGQLLLNQRLVPHKAKNFADDLTVNSSKFDSHQQALTSLVLKVADICFEFQPPKRVSLHFNGHRVVPTTEFSMSTGNTINICSINCTKFLSKTIGISPTATRKLASDNIKQQVLLYLQHIDNCSIRGEHKV